MGDSKQSDLHRDPVGDLGDHRGEALLEGVHELAGHHRSDRTEGLPSLVIQAWLDTCPLDTSILAHELVLDQHLHEETD